MSLKGKKIVLGITGSIAAYKAAFLVRLLVKEGAEVKTVMTPAAHEFVAPLTFSVLSGNPVLSRFSTQDGAWNNHVELANWADFIIIAPASANTIGKLATGICDNLLLAVCLSASCPIYIAPAMDREMYSHFSVKENLSKLQKNNVHLIPAEYGELASGLVGEGRMAEPENIVAFLSQGGLSGLKKKADKLPLTGKRALVTAGPTYEAIDPVRFIGNYSSGKMGFTIADELARQGAEVTLVHGPSQISSTVNGIREISVTSAEEMRNECGKHFPHCDITVMSAAVSDYRPSKTENRKIKKSGRHLSLDLIPTQDILAELGKKKKKSQTLIGFALETDNELENAKGKLKRKNLDAIVLNSMRSKGAGPRSDFNKITIIDNHNKLVNFELKPKSEVAKDIVDYILKLI